MSTLATRIGQEIKAVRTEVGSVATELEMQQGTSTDVKRMSPALVKAAITENAPPAPVTSVNALTGDVVITANDLGANPTIGTSTNLTATGSNVVSSLTLANGVITNHSVRSLTASDVGAAPTANPTFTGTLNNNGKYIGGVVATDTTINTASSNYFTRYININTTFNFSAPGTGSNVYSFTLELQHVGGTITWPWNVKWSNDAAPEIETNKYHLFMFVTRDNGLTWRGAYLANYNG